MAASASREGCLAVVVLYGVGMAISTFSPGSHRRDGDVDERRSSVRMHAALAPLLVAVCACSSSTDSASHGRPDAAARPDASVGMNGGGRGSGGSGPGGRAASGGAAGAVATTPDAASSVPDAKAPPGARGMDARADVGTGSSAEAGSKADAAADAAVNTCRRFVADPALQRKRDACGFTAGAKVAQTLEDAAAARAAIKHLIVVTHENRSMDHMYGTIGHGIEGFPATYTNLDASGKAVKPAHMTTFCPADISHSVASITAEWDNGKMDGFVKTDGLGAFGYYEPADHPFYSWLITTFAAGDHYFCSTLGATGENRRFLYGASANANGSANIVTELNAAKVDWGDYFVGSSPIYNTFSLPANFPGAHPYAEFLPALDAGTLPSVVFLDTPSDEHPPGSMRSGEGVIYDIVSHALASPLWPHLAIVFNYDEGGGFFDHVPPPPACPPTTSAADAPYTVEGIRVPLMVISPYARKAYVSHVHHSHTSVTRLIELLHDLPAISARDANSDALLDMFDFECPDFVKAPAVGPKPPGGC